MVSNKNWQFNLRREMLNPDAIIMSSSEAVVLRDSFPKAEFHFLVVPKTELENVFALNHSHLSLLDDMYNLSNRVIKSVTHLDPKEFLIGFKMDPLMKQLNLHVISMDFVSDRLKTKRHWTNFHTRVFLPYRIAYGILKIKGVIKPLSAEELDFERKRPMVCNQCDFVTNGMFALKTHLMTHWYEKQQQRKINNVPVTSNNQTNVDVIKSQNLPKSASSISATSLTNVQPMAAQRAAIQDSTSKEFTQTLSSLTNSLTLEEFNQTKRKTAGSQELPKTSVKESTPSMLVRLMETRRASNQKSPFNEHTGNSTPLTNLITFKELNKTERDTAAFQESSKASLTKESSPSTLVRLMEAQRPAIRDSTSKESSESSSPLTNLITIEELNQSVKMMQLSKIPTMQDTLRQAKLKNIFDMAKANNNAGRGQRTMPNKRLETNVLGQQSDKTHSQPTSSPPVFYNVKPANQITWKNPFKQPTPLLENGTSNNFQGRNPFKANNYNHQPARNNTGSGGQFHFKQMQPNKPSAGPAAQRRAIPTTSTSTAIESSATISGEPQPPSVQYATNQYKNSYKKPNQRFPKKVFHDTQTNGTTEDQNVKKPFNNKKKWQPNANNTPKKLSHQHNWINGNSTNVPTNPAEGVMKW